MEIMEYHGETNLMACLFVVSPWYSMISMSPWFKKIFRQESALNSLRVFQSEATSHLTTY